MKFYLGLLLIFVVSCHQIQDEEEIETELQGFNWNGVKKCLMEAAPLIPEIQELIQLIKAHDYKRALALALKLIQKGIKVVQTCLDQFKTKDLFALSPNNKIEVDKCLINHQGHIHPNITIAEITNSTEYKNCKLQEEKKKKEQEKERRCYQNCMKTHKKFVTCGTSRSMLCLSRCKVHVVSYIKEFLKENSI